MTSTDVELLRQVVERAASLNAAAAERIQLYMEQGGRLPAELVELFGETAAEVRHGVRAKAQLQGADLAGLLGVLEELEVELGLLPAPAKEADREIIVQGVLFDDCG